VASVGRRLWLGAKLNSRGFIIVWVWRATAGWWNW
jgi:hypothetical protein